MCLCVFLPISLQLSLQAYVHSRAQYWLWWGVHNPAPSLYSICGLNTPRASRKLNEKPLSCSQMMSVSASSVRPRVFSQPWPVMTAQMVLSAFLTSMIFVSAQGTDNTYGEYGSYIKEIEEI